MLSKGELHWKESLFVVGRDVCLALCFVVLCCGEGISGQPS